VTLQDGAKHESPDPLESPAGPLFRAGAHRTFDDTRMETIMGRLLQAGVMLAAGIVLAGGGMLLLTRGGAQPDYRTFVAHPLQLRHSEELLTGLARGDAAAIVELGILVLIATPICRVAFAAVAFAIERDRLYVAISLIVLAVLLLGMLRGG
jgi:uncharacterized membrane protein